MELKRNGQHWIRNGKDNVCSVTLSEQDTETIVRYCLPVKSSAYRLGERAKIEYGKVNHANDNLIDFDPIESHELN